MAPIRLTYFYANFVTTAMSAFPKEIGSSVQRIRLKWISGQIQIYRTGHSFQVKMLGCLEQEKEKKKSSRKKTSIEREEDH